MPLGLMISVSLGLFGCSDSPSDNATQLAPDKVKSNLILSSYRVSMDADYPPYSYRSDKGEAIGFDVDMLKSIGEIEGFSVEIEPNQWSAIIPSVEAGKYAIGIGGIARSDVKQSDSIDKVLTTNPYNYGQDAIAMRVSHATEAQAPNTLDILKNYRIATIEDSGYMMDVKHLQQGTDGTVIAEPTTFLAYKDLFNNHADVVLADKGSLQHLSKNNPKLPIVIGGQGKYFDDPYGMVFVIDKNHPELHTKINHGINILITNGTYQQLHTKWFGTPPKYQPNQIKDKNLSSSDK